MKKLTSLFIGLLFITGILGTSPAFSAEKSTTTTTPASEKSKAATPAKVEAPKATSKSEPLDINSASVDELKALKGIGDAYAKKIVDNRPYKRKDELTRKKVIPQATYDGIKDQIIAHQVKAGSTKPAETKSTSSAAKDASHSKTKK